MRFIACGSGILPLSPETDGQKRFEVINTHGKIRSDIPIQDVQET